MAAHSPEYKVQRKGVDETGIRYELSPDVTSAMVGVLIPAHYARHQRSIARASEFATDLIILDDEYAEYDDEAQIYQGWGEVTGRTW